jgi:hypothetical protein
MDRTSMCKSIIKKHPLNTHDSDNNELSMTDDTTLCDESYDHLNEIEILDDIESSTSINCSGSDHESDNIPLSCQDFTNMPETEIAIRCYVVDPNSPYLSLQVKKFGVFYPDIENDSDHFYFACLFHVCMKDFSLSDSIILIEVTMILIIFGEMHNEPCPNPHFTHDIPVII